MIYARIEDLERYIGLGTAMDTAIRWVLSGAWKGLPAGKTEIDGDRVFALGSTYIPRPERECRYEAHRRYADIQILESGMEFVGFAFAATMEVSTDYSEANDILFLAEGSRVTQADKPVNSVALPLVPGIALVLFPEDAHMPCVACGENAGAVRKIVVKVRID